MKSSSTRVASPNSALRTLKLIANRIKRGRKDLILIFILKFIKASFLSCFFGIYKPDQILEPHFILIDTEILRVFYSKFVYFTVLLPKLCFCPITFRVVLQIKNWSLYIIKYKLVIQKLDTFGNNTVYGKVKFFFFLSWILLKIAYIPSKLWSIPLVMCNFCGVLTTVIILIKSSLKNNFLNDKILNIDTLFLIRIMTVYNLQNLYL